MIDEVVLGIDIGTASTKGVLATLEGTVVRSAQRDHGVSRPRPAWAEHDALTVWWNDVQAVCLALRDPAYEIVAVCVSGIGPCLLPCDANGVPLRPAILYGIDTRAAAEIEELDNLLGEAEILARGGSTLTSQAVGPKLLWLRRNEPEVWEQTAGWYMASSFVVRRLTGEYVLDRHSASQCDPLYDMERGDWAHDWVEAVAPGKPLPRLSWPAEIVGTVTPTASAATGLRPGTPVAAGTIDAWAEAFSVGVRREGDMMLMYGSTMFVIDVVGASSRSPTLWFTEGVEPGRRTLAAGLATSGSLTEWLRGILGGPPWGDLVNEAAMVPAGSRGLLVLPYFAGERTPIYDPRARGVVAGLTLRHGSAELVRATYEGIGFAVRHALSAFRLSAGAPRRIVAVGGGTRAPLWLQIVSDVTGLVQSVPTETIGASYGDALLAAIAAGLVSPETDWTALGGEVEPNASHTRRYDELFELYLRLYPDTSEIAHGLGAFDGFESGQSVHDGDRGDAG